MDILQVFSGNPDDAAASGERNGGAALDRVLIHRPVDALAVQHRDIRNPVEEYGGFEERFWNQFKPSALVVDGSQAVINRSRKDEAEFLRIGTNGVEQRDLTLALDESERTARAVSDTLNAHIAILDRDGRILAVNEPWREFARRNGASLAAISEGVNYLTVCDAAGNESPEAAIAATGIRDVLAGRICEFSTEYSCHSPGEKRWFVVRVTRVPGDGPRRAVVAHESVTARANAEHAALREKEFSNQVIETVQIIVLVLSPEGRIIQFNRRLEELSGRSLEETRGQDWFDLFLPIRNREQARKLFHRAIVEGSAQENIAPLVAVDGRELEIAWHDVVLKNADGDVEGLLCSGRDITAQKQAEDSLLQSEERLRLALQASGIGTFEIDLASGESHWNTIEFELLGLEPGDAPACPETFFRYVHPHDLARVSAEWDKALRVGELDAECRIVRADGQERWLAAKGRFALAGKAIEYRPESGERPSRFLGVTFDITARKQAEVELQAREAQLRSFVQQAPAAIAMFDRNMNYLAVSRHWASDYGRGHRDLVGLNHYVVHPDLPDQWIDSHRRGLAGEPETNHEDLWVQADGTKAWQRRAVSPWLDANGNIGGIMIMSQDMSAWKRAEEALGDREARLAAILNTAADAVITIDVHGGIQSVNLAAERMFAYAAAEMIGKNVKMLMPAPYQEEHDDYLSKYSQTGEKHMIGVGREVVGRRKGGSTFPMELAISEVGHLKLFTGIIRDISRRKDLEREVVEIASLEQLRIGQDLHDTVSQELSAIGMIADDLTEILQTNPSGGARLLERIVQGARRSRQQLRAVMHGLMPVAVDGNGLMAALSDLAIRVQQEGKVTCAFDCPEPVMVTDNLIATHLYLIAQEAVHNAVKHAHARNIRISAEGDRFLVVRVHDDGIGVPDSKAANYGGLGLRIMCNRASIIRGTLTIERVQPTGTLLTCTVAR